MQFGDEVLSSLIWAQHEVFFARPLFLDTTYRMEQRFADKGRSTRSGYIAMEFSVRDSAGDLFATGRHKLKWLMAPSS